MSDEPETVAPSATHRRGDATFKRWIASAGILSAGLIIGGFVLGDGLVRMKAAERTVTVRGLAEREVTADLATCRVRRQAPIKTPWRCANFSNAWAFLQTRSRLPG